MRAGSDGAVDASGAALSLSRLLSVNDRKNERRGSDGFESPRHAGTGEGQRHSVLLFLITAAELSIKVRRELSNVELSLLLLLLLLLLIVCCFADCFCLSKVHTTTIATSVACGRLARRHREKEELLAPAQCNGIRPKGVEVLIHTDNVKTG